MSLTADSILTQLRQRQFAPLYFLQGEEPYYIDQISSYIELHALPEHEKGFNQVVIYGKDADVPTVLMNAKRFPMMADRQVVIVKEAQSLPDFEKEESQRLLEAYFENPVPSTILVFCYKHKTIDSRRKAAKALGKKAVVLTTKKLWENQVPAWISQYVKEKQLKISARAVALLAEYIGADLSRLANEIDKLTINLEPGKEISEHLVHEHVGISKDYNIFELQAALISKDVLKANRIVQHFEANPKNNPVIPNISLLFGFFSKLLVAHGLKDKSDSALREVVPGPPQALKSLQQALRVFDGRQTLAIIRYLRQADLQSKGIEGGSMNDGQILKELVFKILHPFPADVAAALQLHQAGGRK